MVRVLLLVCLLAACSAPRSSTIGLGTSHPLVSRVLGETRRVQVWSPRTGPGQPVVATLYVIDGGVEQDFPHIAGLGQLGEISGTYGPVRVVGVETRERIHELTATPRDPRYVSAYPTAGGAAAFRRHLIEEVVPFVEGRHGPGGRRALIGESLAGLFVLDTFVETPGAFDDYVAVSPSLWWDGQALASSARASLSAREDAGRRLFLAMADERGTMRTGLETVLAVLESGVPGLEWHFDDRSATEHHDTIYHGTALAALRWLYDVPREHFADPLPWWLTEDGAPPAAN